MAVAKLQGRAHVHGGDILGLRQDLGGFLWLNIFDGVFRMENADKAKGENEGQNGDGWIHGEGGWVESTKVGASA